MARAFLACLLALSTLSTLPVVCQDGDLADQMEKAIATLTKAGEVDDNAEALAMMLNSCAEGYIQRGDFKTALERCRQSLWLCRKHGFDSMTSFFTLSKILSQSDDDAATGMMVAELEAPDLSPAYRKGLLKAIEMHVGLRGDPKLAVLVSFELWKMHHEESPGSEAEFWALFTYGNHSLTNRLFDNAVPALTGAREIAVQLGKPELAAHCSRSLANALLQSGRTEEALDLTREAVAFIRTEPDPVFLGFELQNLARMLLPLGRLDEAGEAINEALTHCKNDFETGTVRSLETLLALKRAVAANPAAPDYIPVIAKQKEAIAAKLKNTVAGEAFAKLGATHDFIALAAYQLQAGDPDAAKESLRQAAEGADAWEANSREAQKAAVFSADQVNLSMAEIRAGIHEILQQIEVRRKNPVEALAAAENGRGSAQAALLREKLGFEPEEKVVKELTAADLLSIAKEHGGTLVVYSLVQGLTIEARLQLSAGEAARFPRELYAWVVTPDGKIDFRSAVLPAPVGELVTRARQEIRHPKADDAQAPEEGGGALQRLAGLLLDSIADLLPREDGSLVTFIPQRELFLVPFAALPFGKEGKTLLDHHTVTLSPSIELLRLARQRGQAVAENGGTEILIVGNPTMPDYKPGPDRSTETLSPLPGAEAEARQLAELLGAEALTGDAATETAVSARMESARLLHFATHGILEAESSYNHSLLSSLAFAPSPEEDGFLTAKEIARMKLKAELAVLSACDTGRGAITGDGVIGLSRGFITAGVPTLVVSLWPVSDEATAVLMTHYYRAIRSGTNKAAALREAMLETRKTYPATSLWAPFVLYGFAG